MKAIRGSRLTRRILYLDAAKCIAIMLIIVGHIGLVFNVDYVQGGVPYIVTRLAFSVHLPIFFLTSGYFLRGDQRLNYAYIKSISVSLLVPYFVTCLLITISGTVVSFLSSGFDAALMTLGQWIGASLMGACANSDVALFHFYRIGGIWFLLALFWIRIFVAATNRLGLKTQIGISVLLLIASVISARNIWLPLSIQSGMGCMLYVVIGRYCRESNIFESMRYPLFLEFLGVWVIDFMLGGGRASLGMSVYPLGALDVVAGIAGAMVVIELCKLVESHSKIPGYIQLVGRSTLPIFCLHIFEDNLINWGMIASDAAITMNGVPYCWFVVLLVRLMLISILVTIAFFVPKLNKVYFGSGAETAREMRAALTSYVRSISLLS